MSVSRLAHITQIGVEQMGDLADSLNDPHVLRLENLDTAALKKLDPGPVKAALLMSPSMPTGAVFNRDEWQALVDFCQLARCWLINDSAMERLLYDERPVIHPASFPGMRKKVITVGSASKEYLLFIRPISITLTNYFSVHSTIQVWIFEN